MKNYKLIISLMSGTSLDGVDGLLVKIFDDCSFEFIETHSIDYSLALKEKILLACNNRANTKDITTCWNAIKYSKESTSCLIFS